MLDDLTQTATAAQPITEQLLEATVATTATGAGDDVFVLDPLAGDEGQRLGPCPWTPRPGPAYPQRGDTALIARSDQGRWWILAWETA